MEPHLKAYRNEVLQFININKMTKQLEKLEPKFTTFRKDENEFWFTNTCFHEAAHKTIDEVVFPNSNPRYIMDGELPSTIHKADCEFKSYTDYLLNVMTSHVAGYVGEAYLHNLNVYELAKQIEENGKLQFYVDYERYEGWDSCQAYSELLMTRLSQIKITEFITITSSCERAWNIIIDNNDRFMQNVKQARKYFYKKLKELYESKEQKKQEIA